MSTIDPDNAAALAEQAYMIYRGMKREGPPATHWKDMREETRGAFIWVARFVMLHANGQLTPMEK